MANRVWDITGSHTWRRVIWHTDLMKLRRPPAPVIAMLATAGPTFGALAAYTGPPSVAHFVWLGAMTLALGLSTWSAELEPGKKKTGQTPARSGRSDGLSLWC